MDSFIFSVLYELIHFLFTLNPAVHRMGNASNVLCARCKEQKRVSTLFYILLQAFQNYTGLHQWTNQSEIRF